MSQHEILARRGQKEEKEKERKASDVEDSVEKVAGLYLFSVMHGVGRGLAGGPFPLSESV